MYTINFQTLSIKNFLSVGETPLNVHFKEGINVITGVNRDKEDSKNGVGKSTVIDALYFALYGSTIRELTKDLIVNSYAKKNCEVVLDFLVNTQGSSTRYRIVRQLSPTKCTLYRDEKDVTLSTILKTNEFIQSIIRTTGGVFQNSVVMSANSTVPFMAQSKNDKRKFIENILNLGVFSSMLNTAREEYNECKREYEVLYSKHEISVKMYDTLREQFNVFETNKQTRIQSFKTKIEKNIEQICALEKEIKSVTPAVYELIETKVRKAQEACDKVEVIYRQQYQSIAITKAEFESLKAQLQRAKTTNICPTCKREFDGVDLNHRDKHIESLESNISSVESVLMEKVGALKHVVIEKQNTDKRIKDVQAHKKKIDEIEVNNKNYLNRISYIKESNKTFEEDINNIEKETNMSLESSMLSTSKDITALKETVNCKELDLKVLDYIKYIVSEEGVKSYIVKKILNMLNSRLAYYLHALHSNCICTFNEFFEDNIIDEQGNNKSYFNFSGGERKRMDLACLFAFLDIRRLQGDVTFSAIFYDELLDSALDDKGVDLVIQVLQERYDIYKESCYVITHRGTTMTGKINNIITLEKRNGTTYILNT